MINFFTQDCEFGCRNGRVGVPRHIATVLARVMIVAAFVAWQRHPVIEQVRMF